MAKKIHIIGMGEDGSMNTKAKAVLQNIDTVFSSQRLLSKIKTTAKKNAWKMPFLQNMQDIENIKGDVAILATGDPSYFGVSTMVQQHFNKEDIIIYPHAGAFSYVSARMGWATQDCACITIHGRAMCSVLKYLHNGRKIIVLSHNEQSPLEVGTLLSQHGFGDSSITVLENLGGKDENISYHKADTITGTFDTLNCIAIECVGTGLSLCAGLPDAVFANDGQLTKREVRSATLSALQPKHGEVLWDIGAGSGAISIEWSRLGGIAHAVEKNPKRIDNIYNNAKNLGVIDIGVYQDNACDALDALPEPDAIFIGGGITDTKTLHACIDALKTGGRLVANTVTLEGEAILISLYNQYGGEMCRISVDRLTPVGGFSGWKPLMPVTQYILIKGQK